MTDVTVTNDPPAANTSEARTPDGTLKDVSLPPSGNTTPTPTETPPKADGDTFLTSSGEPKKETPTPPKDGDPKPGDPPKEGDKKPDAAAGAPEKYADFKLPDGYKFDDKTLTAAQTKFKELGLTQDAAQQLVDLYSANAIEAREAPFKEWANLQKEWNGEIARRFPGDKSGEVKTMISGVIDSALPPSLGAAFRKALDITGAGSNPDVVEAFSILFKSHSEAKPVKGNGPSELGQKPPNSGPPSIADALYGHLRK